MTKLTSNDPAPPLDSIAGAELPVSGATGAGCAWIADRFVDIAQARIPILDLGFTHSDLTYDVAGVWDGRFFRLDDHLERLYAGCKRLRLLPPFGMEKMRDVLVELVARSGIRDAYVAMIVTRGVPQPGMRDPRQLSACFYAYAVPYIWIVDQDKQESGVSLAITRGTVRTPESSMDPTVKNFQWGDFTRALFEAYDTGASLPVLTDGEGNITEGAGYNVFALLNGRLYTAAKGVLEGITRRTIIELAQARGIETVVGAFSIESLLAAEEIFLTSTAGGVMPVATLDGRSVGKGRPGPVTRDLRQAYWDLHTDDRYTVDVDYPGRGAISAG
jgi:branched-chain amino acid aminotransferase